MSSSPPPPTIYDTDDMSQFKIIFDSLWIQSSGYDWIYVSFGAKYNSSSVSFERPSKYKDQPVYTNAYYQLIPGFLRARKKTDKILFISVDHFEDDDNKVKNIKMIHQMMGEINSTAADFVIFDQDCTLDFFDDFTRFFFNYIANLNVSSERCVVANYIRFITPNHTEQYLETNIPKTVERAILSIPGNHKYIDCFYQWFGYNRYAYNLIYKYNKYKNLFGFIEWMNICQRELNDQMLICENASEVYQSATNSIYGNLFWKSVCDITYYYVGDQSPAIAENMYEYLERI